MNLDKKTTKSNYFSAQRFSNESRDCKVEYSIKIKCKDEDESKGFVTLDVVRNQHEHSHSDKKTQIRGKLIFRYYSYSLFTYYSILGDERDELAKACLVEANGSPFNFVNNRIAEVIKMQMATKILLFYQDNSIQNKETQLKQNVKIKLM